MRLLGNELTFILFLLCDQFQHPILFDERKILINFL